MERKNLLIFIVFGAVSFLILTAISVYLLFLDNSEKASEAINKVATSSSSPNTTEAKIDPNKYSGNLTEKIGLRTVNLTGIGTQGMEVDTETGLVYISNNSSITSKCKPNSSQQTTDTLSIVDPKQDKEIVNIATDKAPIWPFVDKVGNRVLIAASSGTVAIHERGSGNKLGTIQVGGLPHQVGVVDNLMIVSNTFNQSQEYFSIVDLSTQKVVSNTKGPRLPHPIVVDEQQKIAYIMSVENGTTSIVDMTTGSIKETFTFEGGSGQLAISKKTGKAFTSANKPGSSAQSFDLSTKQLIKTVGFNEVNAPGTGLAIDEESGLLFVVIGDQNAVGVASIETMQPLGFFKVGGCPFAVKLDTKNELGFVTNQGDNTLSLFSLKQLKEALSN